MQLGGPGPIEIMLTTKTSWDFYFRRNETTYYLNNDYSHGCGPFGFWEIFSSILYWLLLVPLLQLNL